MANDLISIRVKANESKRIAVENIHLDLLRYIEIDISEFAPYLDEETIATARNMRFRSYQCF